jgi:hypothetical protein
MTDNKKKNYMHFDILDISGLPSLSDMADIPDIPGLSDLSGLSGLSGMADIPDIPGLSDLSSLSGLSGLSGLSVLSGLADMDRENMFPENNKEMNYLDSLRQELKIIDVSDISDITHYEKILRRFDKNNPLYESTLLYDNICLRIIQNPILYDIQDSGQYLRVIQNPDFDSTDILEKVFIIFGLHDDFNPENIDTLIDILGDTNFSISFGDSPIFNINLSLAYFFADNANEDIIYIDKYQLGEQITRGEFDPSQHKYKYLLEKLNIVIKENKLLIVPLCIDVVIKKIPTNLTQYHSIKFCYDYGFHSKVLSQFIKNIYNVNQNLLFMGNNNALLCRQLKYEDLNFYCLTYNSAQNDLAAYEAKKIRIITSGLSKYIIVKISPDYANIDVSQWRYAVEQLPLINTIVFEPNEDDSSIVANTQSYTPHEIASIRKSKNCILYAIPANPETSMKGWIDKSVKENADVLKILHKQTDNSLGATFDTITRIHHNIIIHLEPSAIPVSVTEYNYMHNIFRIKAGMGGLTYSRL